METNINRTIPFKATHPGEILGEELKERGIRQKDFAAKIGMQATHLNEFIKGKRDLSPELAFKLEKALKIPYDSWMRLQKGYLYDTKAIETRQSEEGEALEQEERYSEIINLKVFYKRLSIRCSSAVDRVRELVRQVPFDIESIPERETQIVGFYKHSDKLAIDEKNLRTWLAIAWVDAEKCEVEKEYKNGGALRAAREIAAMANSRRISIDLIVRCLNSFGIAYEVVQKLDKTPVDAYSMKLRSHPVIAVTYRYNDLDKLTFDILHELGHIELHLKDENCSSISIEGYADSPVEREANSFANDALIAPEVWTEMMKCGSNSLYPAAIARIIAKEAEKIGISPSIAVARYKHESNCYCIRAFRSPKIC